MHIDRGTDRRSPQPAGNCETNYPILLIHGIGFRDRKHLDYWGRIPKALQQCGARVFYGNQDSWATIEQNADILRETLHRVLRETGCERVNIIAHSKGGLEARYLASSLGCSPMIASITTISTPHHGSGTMDMLWRLPKVLLCCTSVLVNLWFRLLGDAHPDFYQTCEQLTTTSLKDFNQANPDVEGVLYQSYATAMKSPRSDMVMCFTNWVIGLVEGENDGIVSVESAKWTGFGGVWRGTTHRGISHPDAVDLRRRNFTRRKGDEMADIRNCYIRIVSKLREMGL